MNTPFKEKSPILEIAVNSYASAMAAEKGGADRIELFSGYADGGLTPSFALVEKISVDCILPIMVMIRAREGNFNYSTEEIEIMKNDIQLFKKLNIFGFVFGVLTNDFKVDKKNNSQLLKSAAPFPCTFHRAFDFLQDPFQGLSDCIELGFTKILSSGQEKNCLLGAELLYNLKLKSDGKIDIMPGAGITSENILEILKCTTANEFHTSAKEIIKANINPHINKDLKEILSYTQSNVEEILKIKKLLH